MMLRARARAWLAQASGIAADELLIAPLPGAHSSAVYEVGNARDPKSRGFVLRVFTDQQWLREEPDLALHEAAALREAAFCGVNAPALVSFETGDAGFGGPVVLMSRVSGDVELRPGDLENYLAQLAHALRRIHAHAAPDFDWHYRSWIEPATLQVPAWTEQPQLWRSAIELWRAGPPDEEPEFLHRDFHPCNVLWQGARVSGVVDWSNACRGPRGVDVAHCRTNLALLFGVETADAFRDAYLGWAGGAHHAHWDVASILEFALPEPEFYRPWREFGVATFDAHEMARRLEAYLKSVIHAA